MPLTLFSRLHPTADTYLYYALAFSMMHLHREPYRPSSSLRRSLHSNLFDDNGEDFGQSSFSSNSIKPVKYNVLNNLNTPSTSASSSANNEDRSAPAAATADDNTIITNNTDNQTLQFTLIFLSLMILYIGFCCHYRKVKIRRSVADDGSNHDGAAASGSGSNSSRRQRAQTNRAVLDESSSAAARAATDEEERRKLGERRGRIMEVLLTRLIVDDDEEEEVCGEGGRDDGIDNDEEMGIGNVGGGEEMIKKTVHAEGEGNDDGETPTGGPGGVEATVPSSSEGTLVTMPSNVTTSTEETTSNNETSTMEEESSVTAPSASSQLRATPQAASVSSPFRKYADALSCNNCHHHATNYCNNTNINCNTQSNNNNDAIANNNNSSNTTTTNKKHPHQGANTITLSTIQQIYGEECNICLSNFQVGDRAAWNKHHQHHSLLQQQGQQQHGCTHVFHEECMSRWLLVRDGCPICRRSYLDNAIVDDDEAEGDGREERVQQQEVDAGEEGRDLESGRGGHRAIIAAED